MERRFFVLALTLGAALAGGVQARAAQELPFLLDLPPGFVVKARPRGPDFDVYDVLKGDVGYVGVYVGNYANFPMNTAAKVIDGPRPNIRIAESPRPGGGVRREYQIRTRSDWPSMLHIWPQDVPGDQALADRIAASVRAK
jgi:hypothetical protein